MFRSLEIKTSAPVSQSISESTNPPSVKEFKDNQMFNDEMSPGEGTNEREPATLQDFVVWLSQRTSKLTNRRDRWKGERRWISVSPFIRDAMNDHGLT
jgi:hypothetical protein